MSAVEITAGALGQLSCFSGVSADGLETGGILLGVDHGLAGNVEVRHCGDAGPAALRRRKAFQRDLRHAQALAEVAAEQDGSSWIGEWHTHLVDLTSPSALDLDTYRSLLEDAQTRLTRVLALIVVADPSAGWLSPVVHAWSFTGTVLRSLPIHLPSIGSPP